MKSWQGEGLPRRRLCEGGLPNDQSGVAERNRVSCVYGMQHLKGAEPWVAQPAAPTSLGIRPAGAWNIQSYVGQVGSF
jgi:hypothetical protein